MSISFLVPFYPVFPIPFRSSSPVTIKFHWNRKFLQTKLSILTYIAGLIRGWVFFKGRSLSRIYGTCLRCKFGRTLSPSTFFVICMKIIKHSTDQIKTIDSNWTLSIFVFLGLIDGLFWRYIKITVDMFYRKRGDSIWREAIIIWNLSVIIVV